MSMDKKDVYLALLGRDFGVFLRQCFATIYPGKEFLPNWHIDSIVWHLEQAIEGKMPRLIVNLPPRHLKSFIVSVALPAFILALDPTAKVICVSYSDDLAVTLQRDFRRIVESDWYQKRFPHVVALKSTANEFVTTKGGFRYATSVGGTLTGRGGDFIIIDDPMKPEDALSDKIRETTNEWYRNTLLSRLDDKRHGVIIAVMQRLHVNDLTGYIESSGGFKKLSLPAIALKEETIQVCAEGVYTRREGEALQSTREDVKTLERMRQEIGPYVFAAQYQQTPEAPEGALFKKSWFKMVSKPPAIKQEGRLVISVDTASSKSESADFSAIVLVYTDETGHYVLHAERDRLDYEELQATIMRYAKKYNTEATFAVEAAGVGVALISSLRRIGMKCCAVKPKDSKLVRASWILPTVHQGKVHILDMPGRNQWVETFMNEILSFPHGRHDDYVDSFTQAIMWHEKVVSSTINFYSPGSP